MKPIALTIIPAMLVGGCISVPRLAVTSHAVSDARLRIDSVAAYRSRKGVIVIGLVRRRPLVITPIWGHLHVTGYRAGSAEPMERDAGLGTLPKSGAPTVFSTVLPVGRDETLTRVEVEYRSRADAKALAS